MLEEGPWGGGRAGAAGRGARAGQHGESCERQQLGSGLQLLGRGGAIDLGRNMESVMFMIAKKGSSQPSC